MSDDAAREPFTGISFHQKNQPKQSSERNKNQDNRNENKLKQLRGICIEQRQTEHGKIESPRREELPATTSCAVGDKRYWRPHVGADRSRLPDGGPVVAVTGVAGRRRAWS
jgi:hypothetical protein